MSRVSEPAGRSSRAHQQSSAPPAADHRGTPRSQGWDPADRRKREAACSRGGQPESRDAGTGEGARAHPASGVCLMAARTGDSRDRSSHVHTSRGDLHRRVSRQSLWSCRTSVSPMSSWHGYSLSVHLGWIHIRHLRTARPIRSWDARATSDGSAVAAGGVFLIKPGVLGSGQVDLPVRRGRCLMVHCVVCLREELLLSGNFIVTQAQRTVHDRSLMSDMYGSYISPHGL